MWENLNKNYKTSIFFNLVRFFVFNRNIVYTGFVKGQQEFRPLRVQLVYCSSKPTKAIKLPFVLNEQARPNTA